MNVNIFQDRSYEIGAVNREKAVWSAVHKKAVGMAAAILSILLLAGMAFSPVHAASAGSSTSLFFSKNSVTVGDTVTATVQASAVDTITVRFSGDKLTLVKCSDSNASVSGNSVQFTGSKATLTFQGAAAGNAEVIVSANVSTPCSAILPVSASSQAGNSSDSQSSEQDASASTDNADASDQQNEADPDSSSDGNASAETVTLGNTTYTLGTPDSLPSDRLLPASVTIGESKVNGYTLNGGNEDFFYFYVTAVSGEDSEKDSLPAWYVYDAAEQSMARADEDALSLLKDADTGTTAKKDASDSAGTKKAGLPEKITDRLSSLKSSGMLPLFIALFVFLVLVIVLIIVTAVRHSRRDDEDEEDADFYDEEDEDRKGWTSKGDRTEKSGDDSDPARTDSGEDDPKETEDSSEDASGKDTTGDSTASGDSEDGEEGMPFDDVPNTDDAGEEDAAETERSKEKENYRKEKLGSGDFMDLNNF